MSTLTLDQAIRAYSRENVLSVEIQPVQGYPYLFQAMDLSCLVEDFSVFLQDLFKNFLESLVNDTARIQALTSNFFLAHGIIDVEELRNQLSYAINNPYQAVEISSPPLHSRFHMQQFGQCLGIRVTGMHNEDLRETVGRLIEAYMRKHNNNHFLTRSSIRPFVHRYIITVWQDFESCGPSNELNLLFRLEMFRKFIPWLNWPTSESELLELASELVNRYQNDHKPSTLFVYKDLFKEIDIQGRILFGSKEKMKEKPWRIGKHTDI
jgi:hypothetical protein